MLLHVIHETRYDYAPPVKTAQHMAHLKPAHNARQQLLKHELVISPRCRPSAAKRPTSTATRELSSACNRRTTS